MSRGELPPVPRRNETPTERDRRVLEETVKANKETARIMGNDARVTEDEIRRYSARIIERVDREESEHRRR